MSRFDIPSCLGLSKLEQSTHTAVADGRAPRSLRSLSRPPLNGDIVGQTDTVKPLVRLYDAGLGLVFPWPSGVMYANQACGHACMQPEVEGVFVPFEADESWSRLSEYFEGAKYLGSGAMRGLDAEDADFIDRVLRDLRQGQAITDRARLAESYEAWVHVIVEAELESSLFTGLGPYPRPAILTWPNSD